MSEHMCDTNKARIAYRKCRGWLRWVKQGRPRTHPVIVKVGEVVSCRHGYALVQNWDWDFDYMDMPVRDGVRVLNAGNMVDILGALHGVTRVHELEQCDACNSYVTA